jgi:hypothetical protein
MYAFLRQTDWKNYTATEKDNTAFGLTINGEYVLYGIKPTRFKWK